MKKFAIHPGYVTSATDRQEHYIDASRLMQLFEVRPDECVIWDNEKPETWRGRNWNDYRHLFPSFEGNYGRQAADSAKDAREGKEG